MIRTEPGVASSGVRLSRLVSSPRSAARIGAPLVGRATEVVARDVDGVSVFATGRLVELGVGLWQLVLGWIPDVLSGAESHLAVERGDQQPVTGEALDDLDAGLERQASDDVVLGGAWRTAQAQRGLAVPRHEPDLVDLRTARRDSGPTSVSTIRR